MALRLNTQSDNISLLLLKGEKASDSMNKVRTLKDQIAYVKIWFNKSLKGCIKAIRRNMKRIVKIN